MPRIFIALAVLTAASPALAGTVVATPGEEAGVGLAAMMIVGAGITWLRKRRQG